MSETTWAMIREALERVLSGAARRLDLDLHEAKVSVYRVGDLTRTDITPRRDGASRSEPAILRDRERTE